MCADAPHIEKLAIQQYSRFGRIWNFRLVVFFFRIALLSIHLEFRKWDGRLCIPAERMCVLKNASYTFSSRQYWLTLNIWTCQNDGFKWGCPSHSDTHQFALSDWHFFRRPLRFSLYRSLSTVSNLLPFHDNSKRKVNPIRLEIASRCETAVVYPDFLFRLITTLGG